MLHVGVVALLSLIGNGCASAPASPDSDRALPITNVNQVVTDAVPDTLASGVEEQPSNREQPGPNERDLYRTRSGPKVYGYFVWWTRGLWEDLDLSVYDKIFFFDVTPASDGSLREKNGYPEMWQRLVERADSFAVPVVPSMALLDADALQTLFVNAEHRNRLLQSSLSLIEESGGAGLHLDYEWFAPATDALRDGFHAYLDALAEEAVKQYPKARLSIFVPAFQPQGMIDISRIPDAFADVVVQGYDIHWLTSPVAGPLSPLHGWSGSNWHTIVRGMEQASLKRKRMFLTVPYYGYEWPTDSDAPGAATRGPAQVTTYGLLDPEHMPDLQLSSRERAERFGQRRDSVSGSPHYAFSDSTGWYQGWYEDPVSLAAKYRFVNEQGLAGVAVFPIGYDGGQLKRVLLDQFGSRRVAYRMR
jgi:spore germination protein YaaH